ncbi:MAG: glycosyltransferase [Candidatus Latescibacteria bacterium]|nr:glycosyltransferase [Candidatus Latescibacterota bacterium]NIM22270.1 glycosyltransferase [Candidatus Latescibacterota bacterium]NIM65749.1 glycosyltransferase [Candidatus Latescibacterota bacterium]NIO02134.1 glycosyltransferase [Candidatus Latescibacterota bacterium]NIO28966.1 glycosyltransferase [Candidatus Latescibacterota bacterium]
MKICIVALDIVPYFQDETSTRFGGAEVQAAALARAFASGGADVSLVVSNLPENVHLPFPAENAYYSERGIWGVRFFHPRLSGIYRALERADADVYYQHCAGSITGVTAVFCRRKKKVFVYGAGSNSDFSFSELLITGLRDKILYFLGLKLADGIVAQNQIQKGLCKKKVNKTARVIPMVIDVSEKDRLSSGGKVLWIGPIRKVKRPEMFLELARRFPDREFVLIGGSISTELAFANDVRRQAQEVPNLAYMGRIPRDEVIHHLQTAAILVNTSSVEGFPNVFLEAWKCGVPVISFTDVDGLIAGEGVGILCNSVKDMEQAMRALLGEEERRASMGRKAAELISSKFSPAVLSKRYLAYFSELLENRIRCN